MNNGNRTAELPRKNPALGILSLTLVIVLLALVVTEWIHKVDILSVGFSVLAHISFAVWWIVTWWSLYHLIFHITGLLIGDSSRPTKDNIREGRNDVRFAILYLTCDDFQPNSCLSCIRQKNYASTHFSVFICDDSTNDDIITEINLFRKNHPEVTLLQRKNRSGYKAGNLNYAFSDSAVMTVDWAVVADADQTLPEDYLSRLAPIVAAQPREVAYVQTAHLSDHLNFAELPGIEGQSLKEPTVFQRVMGTEVQLYYERTLRTRERFGFVPFLGHGAAIRRSAWVDVGGFPPVVSEDYAFSMKLRQRGMWGVYEASIISYESFPFDFGAFLVRLKKFSGGTAELFRCCLKEFVTGKAAFAEKLDLLMCIGWYPLMLLVLMNLFLSAFVCATLWDKRIGMLHPVLPFVFTGMFFLTASIILSLNRGVLSSLRYWFWSIAVYNACLPVAAWHFLIHLNFQEPRFERTPKRGSRCGVSLRSRIAVGAIGAIAVVLSVIWSSPFSPMLLAYALSFLLFNTFTMLNDRGWRGRVTRLLVLAPGIMIVEALRQMWFWGKL